MMFAMFPNGAQLFTNWEVLSSTVCGGDCELDMIDVTGMVFLPENPTVELTKLYRIVWTEANFFTNYVLDDVVLNSDSSI